MQDHLNQDFQDSGLRTQLAACSRPLESLETSRERPDRYHATISWLEISPQALIYFILIIRPLVGSIGNPPILPMLLVVDAGRWA